MLVSVCSIFLRFIGRRGCPQTVHEGASSHFQALRERADAIPEFESIKMMRICVHTASELETVLVRIDEALMSSAGSMRRRGAHSRTPADRWPAPALRTPDRAGLSCLRQWRLVSVRQTFWRRWSRGYKLP
ncbi:uncharacterized protein LOC120449510 [Drosophila santomea]|uniref:uncharacterized protein LOC120449510 n=1 Tax=Drosophila santomea TaxID=129105 RepID=UPI0019543ACF|nr:uncharacterized protein LOC120449510 [Drosophila santomea]